MWMSWPPSEDIPHPPHPWKGTTSDHLAVCHSVLTWLPGNVLLHPSRESQEGATGGVSLWEGNSIQADLCSPACCQLYTCWYSGVSILKWLCHRETVVKVVLANINEPPSRKIQITLFKKLINITEYSHSYRKVKNYKHQQNWSIWMCITRHDFTHGEKS